MQTKRKLLSLLIMLIILTEIITLARVTGQSNKTSVTLTNKVLENNNFLVIEAFFPKEIDVDDNLTGIVALMRTDKLEYVKPSELIVELRTIDNHTLAIKTLDDMEPVVDNLHFLTSFRAIYIPSKYLVKIYATWNPPWGGEISTSKTVPIYVGFWRRVEELINTTHTALYNISFGNFLREVVESTRNLGLDGVYYLMLRQLAVKAKAQALEANMTLPPELKIYVLNIPNIISDVDTTQYEVEVNNSLSVLDSKGISYTVHYIRTMDEWLQMLDMNSMDPRNIILINCHGSVIPAPSSALEDIYVLSSVYDISQFLNMSIYDVLEEYGDARAENYTLWTEDFNALNTNIWNIHGIPELSVSITYDSTTETLTRTPKAYFMSDVLTLNPTWASEGARFGSWDPYVSTGLLELTGLTTYIGHPSDVTVSPSDTLSYEMKIETKNPISITDWPVAYLIASATPIRILENFMFIQVNPTRFWIYSKPIRIYPDEASPYPLQLIYRDSNVGYYPVRNMPEYFYVDFYDGSKTLTYVYWINGSGSLSLTNTTNHKYLVKKIYGMGVAEFRSLEMKIYEDWKNLFGSLPSSLYISVAAHNLVLHVDRIVLGDALVHWLTYTPDEYDMWMWFDVRSKEKSAYELIMEDDTLRAQFLNWLIKKGYINKKDVQVKIYRQFLENVTTVIGGKHWIWVSASDLSFQTSGFHVTDTSAGLARMAMPFDWVANTTLMREVQGFSYLKERNYWDIDYTLTANATAIKTNETSMYIEDSTTGLGVSLPSSITYTSANLYPLLFKNPDMVSYYETEAGYVTVGAYLGGNGIYVFNLMKNMTIACLAAYATWFSQWGVKSAEIVSTLEIMSSILYSYNTQLYNRSKQLAGDFNKAWSQRDFQQLSLLFNDTMNLCDEVLETFDDPLENLLNINVDIYSSLKPYIDQVFARLKETTAAAFSTVIEKINEIANYISGIEVSEFFDRLIKVQQLIMVAAPLISLLAWGAGFGSMTLFIMSAMISLGAHAGIQALNWVKQTFKLIINTIVGVLNYISRILIVLMRQIVSLMDRIVFFIQQGLFILSNAIHTAVAQLASLIAKLATLVVSLLTEALRKVQTVVNTAIRYFALKFDELTSQINTIVGDLQRMVYNLSRAIYSFPEIKDTIYKLINEAWKRFGWLRYALENLGRTIENFIYSIIASEPLELLRQVKEGIFGGLINKYVTGTTLFFIFQQNGTLIDASSVKVTISSVQGVVEEGYATRVAKGIYAYKSQLTLQEGVYSAVANATVNGDWITATSEFYVESVEQPKQGDLYFSSISVSSPREVTAGSSFPIQVNATQVMWHWGLITLRVALIKKGAIIKAIEIAHISVGPEAILSKTVEFSIPLLTWPGEYELSVSLIEELTGDETTQTKPLTVKWGLASYAYFTVKEVLFYVGAIYGIITLIKDIIKRNTSKQWSLK